MIQPLPGTSRARRRAGSLPPILAQHDTSAALQRRRRSQQYGNQVQHMTTKEIDAASIQRVVVAHFRKEMNAERCTLMLLDSAAEELHFRDWEQDAGEVRFDMHAGIAGEALSCGTTINIPDAYKDSRFNPNVDKQTGFCTRSILCAPVFSRSGWAIGVIQMINKQGGPFNASDERTMEACIDMVLRALVMMRSQEYRKESARGHRLLLKTGLESLLKRDLLTAHEPNSSLDPSRGSAVGNPATHQACEPLHARSLAEIVEERQPHSSCATRRSAMFLARRARRNLMLEYGNSRSRLNTKVGAQSAADVLRNTCARQAASRNDAAVTVQACVRRHFFGFGGQPCYLERKAAVVMLQAAARAQSVRRHLRALNAAAAQIQRSFRASILDLACPTILQYAIQVKLTPAHPSAVLLKIKRSNKGAQ